jgi:hypothetical protein
MPSMNNARVRVRVDCVRRLAAPRRWKTKLRAKIFGACEGFLRLIIRMPLGGRLCPVSPERQYAYRVVLGTDGVESVVLVG